MANTFVCTQAASLVTLNPAASPADSTRWARPAHSKGNGQVEAWVERAMQRWPNVPALFGWLGLDRRGRWLIKGEPITHPRIVATINNNYAADAHGRWYFQNGPQRGYMQLEYAPLLLRTSDDTTPPITHTTHTGLMTHTGLQVERLTRAFIDETGAMLLLTEHGPGEIIGTELDWILQRLSQDDQPIGEEELADALALPSGATTRISLDVADSRLPLERLDAEQAPAQLHFVRDPQPRSDEKVASQAPD